MAEPENSTESGKPKRVLYGKPFQKGVSGNPGGRPKEPWSLRGALRRASLRTLKVTVDGEEKEMTYLDATMLRAWNDAAQGGNAALNFVSRVGAVQHIRHEGSVTVGHGLEGAAPEDQDMFLRKWREIHPEAFAEAAAAAGGNGKGNGKH